MFLCRIRRPTSWVMLVMVVVLVAVEAAAFAFAAGLAGGICEDGRREVPMAAFPEDADAEAQRAWAREAARRSSISICCDALSDDSGYGELKPGPPKPNYCHKGLDCDCRETGRQPAPMYSLALPMRHVPDGSEEPLPVDRVEGPAFSILLIQGPWSTLALRSIMTPPLDGCGLLAGNDALPAGFIGAPAPPPPR